MQVGNSGGDTAAKAATTAATSLQSSALSYSELLRELEDARDKLKIMTNKFATARKERD